MCSDGYKRWAAALLLVSCSRPPAGDDRPARTDRVFHDASTIAAGAPTPDAYVEDVEAERYATILSGEDGHGISGAIEWLVAHPQRARPILRADLSRQNAGGINIKFELQILGRIGDPADVPLLRDWLLKASETQAFSAADALRLHPSPEAFDALLDGAASSDPHQASRAVDALGKRGDERARRPIEQLLDHAESNVRYSAVRALAALGVEPSRALLEARQHIEQDKDVSSMLANVLSAGSP